MSASLTLYSLPFALLAIAIAPPLVSALHENDNYCDNGQNGFWCNKDCSGYCKWRMTSVS